MRTKTLLVVVVMAAALGMVVGCGKSDLERRDRKIAELATALSNAVQANVEIEAALQTATNKPPTAYGDGEGIVIDGTVFKKSDERVAILCKLYNASSLLSCSLLRTNDRTYQVGYAVLTGTNAQQFGASDHVHLLGFRPTLRVFTNLDGTIGYANGYENFKVAGSDVPSIAGTDRVIVEDVDLMALKKMELETRKAQVALKQLELQTRAAR